MRVFNVVGAASHCVSVGGPGLVARFARHVGCALVSYLDLESVI
jgi:hypothetical protein